jgi:transcriptional regulator with XRE-family HTH domain
MASGIMRAQIHVLKSTMPRRKTMGETLKEARLSLNMSMADVQQRIEKEFKSTIGETTIREAERDRFPNPGIKTIELIARALYLDPLDVIALALDNPPAERIEAFEKSRFGQMREIHSRLKPARQAWYDEWFDVLIERMLKG